MRSAGDHLPLFRISQGIVVNKLFGTKKRNDTNNFKTKIK